MRSLRFSLLMPVLAVIVVAAVGGAAAVERSTATTAAARTQSAQALLTAMLDQETGLRGFLLGRQEIFLVPFRQGTAAYDRAEEQTHAGLERGSRAAAILERGNLLARRWHELALEQVADVRQGHRDVSISLALRRKRVFDGFRATNTALIDELADRRVADQRTAQWLSIAIALFVFVLVGGVGTVLVTRRHRREMALDAAERDFRGGQVEFVETLQAVDDEEEANVVLKRHLERWVPGRSVTVLNRNNSDNRLETPAGADGELVERLKDAEPRACVAIRLGRTYEERGGDAPLLRCALCSKDGSDALCSPLLVSGRVIGSVLVRQEQPLDDKARRRVGDSVSQAAPVLGNLRAIAMAETRAHTDALTGLPNRRAVNDTLKRMVAQAHRLERPLAAIALDLDHFKQVNDRYGHDKGDEVLATISAVLMNTVRASDFAGRLGGEEFLVLAPDTHPGGAMVLAEKLRQAIARIEIPGAGHVTASLGVASMPEDAVDPDMLMRRADRALYAAKGNGRDRVEQAARSTPT
jgi:diguanylate cyclase (GGDEF)-like protein